MEAGAGVGHNLFMIPSRGIFRKNTNSSILLGQNWVGKLSGD